ncbi:hypothetical protein KC345_g4235 [Hortaea werneckii]|nr:hypothetical protein KC345_g4235 [Hortaea werneckii]
MPGTINWDNVGTWQRVVAAIVATGVKIDLKSTAMYYGTTYDTLENRFRKIKKLSAELKEEVDNGERGEVKAKPATPRKPRTPKNHALSSVANGRVSKASPTKKKGAIKQEQPANPETPFFHEPEGIDLNSIMNIVNGGSFDAENAAFLGGELELN